MSSSALVLEVVPDGETSAEKITLPTPRRPVNAVKPEVAPHAVHVGEVLAAEEPDDPEDVLHPFSHERKTQTLILARYRGNSF